MAGVLDRLLAADKDRERQPSALDRMLAEDEANRRTAESFGRTEQRLREQGPTREADILRTAPPAPPPDASKMERLQAKLDRQRFERESVRRGEQRRASADAASHDEAQSFSEYAMLNAGEMSTGQVGEIDLEAGERRQAEQQALSLDDSSWWVTMKKAVQNLDDQIIGRGGGGLIESLPTTLRYLSAVTSNAGAMIQPQTAAERSIEDFGKGVFERASREIERNSPELDGSPGKLFAYDLVNAFSTLLTAVGVSAATKNPQAGLAILGAQTFGDRFGQSIKEGRSRDQAFADAAVFALAEVVGENKVIGDLIKPGVGFVTRAGKGAMGEALQEGATSVIQNGYSKGILHPEMTMGDVTSAILRDMALGGAAGGSVAVGSHAFTGEGAQRRAEQRGAIDEIAGTTFQIDEAANRAMRAPGASTFTDPLARRTPGIVETARTTAATTVSPEDEASPIPTDLIQEGKATVAGDAASHVATELLSRAGIPGVGQRVAIDMGGGRTQFGTVADSFTTTDAEHGENSGVRIDLDTGGTFEEFFADIDDAGVTIKPVDEVIAELGDVDTVVGTPDDERAPAPRTAPSSSGGNRPQPVENARTVAEQLFPNVRVTQNRRDPNSALGRKNPGSWHVKSGGAVDVAPIPGLTFDQYVQRFRDAGYTIIEAIDEVKNPSGHATGPHWHVVIGSGGQDVGTGAAAAVPSEESAPVEDDNTFLDEPVARTEFAPVEEGMSLADLLARDAEAPVSRETIGPQPAILPETEERPASARPIIEVGKSSLVLRDVDPDTRVRIDEALLGKTRLLPRSDGAFTVPAKYEVAVKTVVKALERDRVPVVQTAPDASTGRLWTLAPEQLEQMLAEKGTSDRDKLVQAFGDERAKLFERLDRKRNSSIPQHSDEGSREFEQEFGDLTPDQERAAYGIGETDAQADEIKTVLDAHSDVIEGDDADWSSYMAAVAARKTSPEDFTKVASGEGSVEAQASFVRMQKAYANLKAEGVEAAAIPERMVGALVDRGGWDEASAREVIGGFVEGMAAMGGGRAVPSVPAITDQSIAPRETSPNPQISLPAPASIAPSSETQVSGAGRPPTETGAPEASQAVEYPVDGGAARPFDDAARRLIDENPEPAGLVKSFDKTLKTGRNIIGQPLSPAQLEVVQQGRDYAQSRVGRGVAAPAFDPRALVPKLREIVRNTKINLNDTKRLAKALGVTPEQANAVMGALASQPNAGFFVTKGRKATVKRVVIASESWRPSKRDPRKQIKVPPRYKTITVPGTQGRYQRIPRREGPMDVIAFIRSIGGINDTSRNDLRNLGAVRKHVGLIRKSGKSIDELGEALHEAGYIGPERPTEAEVLDLLDRASLTPIYTPEEQGDVARQEGPEDAEQTAAIEALAKNWGLTIVDRDIAGALLYMEDGASAEEALDRAMSDAAHEALEIGDTETDNDFYGAEAETVYGGGIAEQRDSGAEEAVAGPESVEGDAERGRDADAQPDGAGEAREPLDLLGEPVAQPTAKPTPTEPDAQLDAFGTRPEDARKALERRAEGRDQSSSAQKAPGSDGGLFDNNATQADIADATGGTDPLTDLTNFGLLKDVDERYRIAREQAVPVLDLRKAPTGWRELPLTNRGAPQSTRSLIISATANRSKLFEGPNAGALAQAFAIDNPQLQQIGDGPAPELISRPIFEKPTASWVIREKATGKVIMETFDRKKVDALNTAKYEAVPIQEHLASLNAPALADPIAQAKAALRTAMDALEGAEKPAVEAAPKAVTETQVPFDPAAPLDSAAFRKWFGDSKVVDEDGQPLVVYHGSNKSFEAFEPKPGMRNDGGPVSILSPSFFFTTDRPTAEMFARDRALIDERLRGLDRGKEQTGAFYLKVEQPLNLIIDEDAVREIRQQGFGLMNFRVPNPLLADEIGELTGYELNEWADVHRMLDDPDAVAALRDHGYDGVNLLEEDGSESWVAFEPTQIKSTENEGTFDPADPRIRFQATRRDRITEAAEDFDKDFNRRGGLLARGESPAPIDFDAITADWKAKLLAELKRTGIADKVTLRVVDNLEAGPTVAGSYYRRAISVALDVSHDPIETLGHESIHALRGMGLIREPEWTALEKAVETWPGLMSDIRRRYGAQGLSDLQMTEEAIADLYGQWRSERAKVKGFVAQVFQRIADFINTVRAAFSRETMPGQVFRDIEAGRVGAREAAFETRTSPQFSTVSPRTAEDIAAETEGGGRGGDRNRGAASTAPQFNDPDSEARWQDASKGLGDGPGWIETAKGWWEDVAAGFTRHWRDLPNEPRFADLAQQFRKLESSPTAAKERTVRLLRDLVGKMDKAQLDLFTRKVVIDDLTWEADGERQLPFGFTAETLAVEKAKIDRLVNQSPDLVDAVRKRKLINREVADEMVAAGVLSREQIRNPAYFRHMVLDYARAEMRLAKGTGQKIKSPYWAKRMGSSLDINAHLLEAEFEWLQKAQVDIATAKAIDWLKKSEHNIREDLRAKAKGMNDEALSEILETNEEAAAQAKAFRKSIAMGMKKVSDAVEGDQLGIIPDHLQAAAAKLTGAEGDESIFPLLAWMLDNDKPGAIGAAMVLKAAGQRKSWERQLLGSKYIDVADTESLVKKLAPDGYAAWQPVAGRHLFTAKTVPEHILDGFVEKLSAPNVAGIAADEMHRALTAVRSQLVVGGERYTMVLPKEVADTLNEFGDRRAEGLFSQGVQMLQSNWKRWVLINPRRFLKYNINNMSGDLDALIAGNPGALLKVKAAATELYAVMRKGEKPSARYEEAVERGVFDSGLSIQEIPDIARLSAFRHLTDDHGSGRPDKFLIQTAGNVWRALQGVTQWRENVFRYASYLDYIEKIEAGKPTGYGASVPKMVDAVKDPKDKAALLARDLIGDYGSISTAGSWLRRHLIPFWSWTEINTKRYWRLTKNASSQGLGKGIATGGLLAVSAGARTSASLFLRMAVVYGTINLWNSLLFGDDEEDLGEQQRKQMHLVLGKYGDEIVTLRLQGALSDVLSLMGLPDAALAFRKYLDGQGSIGTIVGKMAKAPVNKVATGVNPFIGVPLGQAMGKEIWPDIFSPRDIKDRWRNVFSTFSLENEYDFAFAKPSRGYGRSWQESVLYRRDPGEMAYDESKGIAYDWLARVKGEDSTGSRTSPKSTALREYRQALRFGDEAAAERALAKYESFGGTDRGFAASIKRQHPLGPIAKKDRRAFLETLTPDQYETFADAERWYDETFLDR